MWEFLRHWLDTKRVCPGCEAYKQQIDALRAITGESQRQVSAVIAAHYDRPVVTGDQKSPEILNHDTIHALSDVQTVTDEEFLDRLN